MALYRRAPDEVGQGEGRFLAASPNPIPFNTCLTALRGVNAVQPYPLAVYLDGVSVNDRGRACNVGEDGACSRGGQENDEDGDYASILQAS